MVDTSREVGMRWAGNHQGSTRELREWRRHPVEGAIGFQDAGALPPVCLNRFHIDRRRLLPHYRMRSADPREGHVDAAEITVPPVILKPVMWNPTGYLGPAGHPAGGYPSENGFGHEEWNNSPRMAYVERGTRMRAFHTERAWKAGDPAAAKESVILMYASHDGVQDLVGAAAKARCLVDDGDAREALAARLRLRALGPETWKQPTVRAAYEGDREAFAASWARGLSWIPNWTCPADHFFQPSRPVRLDPRRIRGTAKLLTMFTRYTALDEAAGMRAMMSVTQAGRDAAWRRIARILCSSGGGAADDDVSDIRDDPRLSKTTKQALVDARRGQGRFRRRIEARWGQACAVTSCGQREVLRASHVMPWWSSTNAERLDPANGLLLSANLDALFDRFLITFDSQGSMLVSERVAIAERRLLGLPRGLRLRPTKREAAYLCVHRERFRELARTASG